MSHHLIYTFVLFSRTVFFSSIAILGIAYGGEESGDLYQLFCIACFGISIFCFFFDFVKVRHCHQQLISLIVIFIYVISGALAGYITDKSVLSLIAFCVPSVCVAIYYSAQKSIAMLVRWLDVIVLLLTLSLFFMAMGFYNSIITNSSSSSYSQPLSYFAAFGFLVDIFLVRYGKLYPRFSLFKTRFYRIASFSFLLLYPSLIMLSGGRGGFVTLAVGLIIFYVTNKGSRLKSFWIIVALPLLLIGIGKFIGERGGLELNDIINANSNRVFSYVNEGGLDMRQTSGRDFVYAKSYEMFMERPLMGYGLFGYKQQLIEKTTQGYPHNIFLELLLQGGLAFLLLGLYLLAQFLIKLSKIVKSDPHFIMLLPLVVYPFTELMYSGSYMEEPLFWFSMIFVYNYQLPPKIGFSTFKQSGYPKHL